MKDKKIINFLDYVTIELYGDETLINEVRKYYTDLFYEITDEKQGDYKIFFLGVFDDFVSIPENYQIVHPFKATQYIKFQANGKNYSYANAEQFGCNHLIEKNGNEFKVYAFDRDYGMLFVRISRELIFRELLKRGFIPIHASAVANEDNCADIFIGQSGSGKTTCFLHNVVFEKKLPISSDVIMIADRKKYIEVVGLPFKITSYVKFIKSLGNEFKIKNNRLRIDLSEFQSIIKKKWCWRAVLKKVFLLNYNKNDMTFTSKNATFDEFATFIKAVREEEVFEVEDYLYNGNVNINKDFNFLYYNCSIINGNVLKYFQNNKK